ncbi:hypothetical protein [Cereibacter sphaeroides]|jgi:hypothetical protein|uniref:hypothetical protein n=1 Tax=Cereibacter sphaeroides TaxID=1063 RepID=UPI0000F2A0BB|nr:hypothetical protein Rsph17029_1673 [Cereibacter sphaeroides ATCC 17029]
MSIELHQSAPAFRRPPPVSETVGATLDGLMVETVHFDEDGREARRTRRPLHALLAPLRLRRA